MTDGIGTTNYNYYPINAVPANGAGRLAAIDGPWSNDTVTFSYDELGRTVGRAINAVSQSVAFDAASRISSLTNALGTFAFTFDGPTRRLKRMDIPNGQRTEYQYLDAVGDNRLQQIRNLLPNLTTLSTFTYDYDAEGRIRTWSQEENGTAGTIWTLGYDFADQLTSVVVAQGASTVKTYDYTYDLSGNRLTETTDGATTLFSFNALNQVSAINKSALPVTYEWDAENRLIAVQQGNERSEFSYDGNGHRVGILEKSNGTLVSSATYLWVGAELCEKRDGSGALVQQRFFDHGHSSEAGGSSSPYYYTRDHLKSVREIADVSGQITQRIRYDPFGSSAKTTVADAPFTYTGHLYHSQSGLVLSPFRAYAPALGQWLSRDPLGESAGLNLYAYVGNNPINWFDPLGLSGTLTIHSSGDGGISGHSWISYTPDGGQTTTYGTWGNNPTGAGNGLFENLESGRTGDASRTMHIDDAGESALMDRIQDYRNMGQDAWQYGNPCSGFARDAWQKGTGEDLNANWGPFIETRIIG
jgi:RHS repeat-associated protein